MELKEIFDRIMAGGTATVEEALALNERYSTDELCDAADEVRKARCGGRLDTCSIINARSGHCPEDCKFCAQSRFYATGIKEYEIVDTQEAVDAALECAPLFACDLRTPCHSAADRAFLRYFPPDA